MLTKPSSTTLLLFLGLTALVATADGHSFSQCSSSSADALGITSVTLTPDPPVAGGSLQVQFTGTPTAQVDSGTASLKVKVLGITITTLTFDVCSDLGVSCPLPAGTPFTGSLSYTIPSSAPASISATAEVQVVDGSQNELACIDLSVTISKATTTSSATLTLAAQKAMVSAPNNAIKTFLLASVAANAVAQQQQQQQQNDDEAITVPTRTRKEIEYLFEAWRQEFSPKQFHPDELEGRLSRFAANAAMVERHNADPTKTWKMALNQFAHLDDDEFKAAYLGYKKPANDPRVPHKSDGHSKLRGQRKLTSTASSVDWVSAGAVSEVRNQGQCGSCWSFSTTGAIEGAMAIKYGSVTALSMQQLVDCDTTDDGCSGGLMDNAFSWVGYNGGLCSYDDYPYTSSGGSAGTCSTSCSAVTGSAPTSYTDVTASETALMAALTKQPVSVAIEADQSGFQFYSSGVYTGTCGTSLDHGVLAVGYGTDDGTGYWKVKNSWGGSWGEDGYIRLERGKDQTGGQCGILSQASYPNL